MVIGSVPLGSGVGLDETPATTVGVVSLPALQASAAARASARAVTDVNIKKKRIGPILAGPASYPLDAQ
jgi:hypothetical protein